MSTRKRKPYVDMEDLVSEYFKDYDTDPQVLPNVIEAVSLALKSEAKEAHKRIFPQRTGRFNESIWFKHRKKRGRSARLYAGNLASIYEWDGARIQPMKGKALKFSINGKTVFYTGVIRIPARPYFYPAMREAIAQGLDRRAAEQQINQEFMRHNIVSKN